MIYHSWMLWVILFLIWFKANHGGWWHFPWHFCCASISDSPLKNKSRFREGWPMFHPMCTTILAQQSFDTGPTWSLYNTSMMPLGRLLGYQKWIAGKPATAGVIKWDPFWGGSNVIRRCTVILKDFPCNSALLLHCLAWCHTMTLVLLMDEVTWRDLTQL